MKKIIVCMATLLAMCGLASCGGGTGGNDELTGTAAVVAAASKMSISELEQASKKEMEESNETFKVLGLTSALSKAVDQLAEKYDWIKVGDGGNTFVNNSYKDYTLLSALEPAANSYVADYALVQDARSIADYTASGILHNYVPSDVASYGLDADGIMPLQGIHFNKIFWTNTNFETVTGKKLYNIWQVAGTSDDADHLSKVSFQSPVTEQINMSFLLSVMDKKNEERLLSSYKSYYKKNWEASKDYATIGEQWVKQFIKNITRYHSSDGTAMKETQLKDDWNEGYVYFGAYSKMKDAAGKFYSVAGQETDPILKNLIIKDGENAGKIKAMDTVKWDWNIEGFNGYFYTMFSQVVNNAKHPYTACLFSRYVLEGDFYTKTIYGSKTPNEDGTKGNQYGYYYPGTMGSYGSSEKVTVNSYDWTKAQWKERSLCESYEYLSTVRSAKVAEISSLIKA